MKQITLMYSIALLIGSVLSNSQVQAADCDQSDYSGESYQLMLEEFAAVDCFSIDKNNTVLGLLVKRQLNNNTQDNRVRAVATLQSILVFLDENLISTANSQSANASALRSATLGLKQQIADKPKTPAEGLKTQWKFDRFDRMPQALENIDLTNALTATKCAKVSDKLCIDEFNAAADLVSAIFLINSAMDKYTENYRAETLANRVLRRKKWDSYYDDLTFQYPWELMLNNFLLEKSDKNRVSVDGNKIGFRALPERKLVFLHPEANLVYLDNAEDDYDITLTVEALGYEAFEFDNNTGKIKNTWGISILAAYLDQGDKPESGWTAGLLFKYNGYSLGVTDNHGDAALVFNINLSQRIFDVKQESRQYYDEYQGKVQRFEILLEEGQQKLDEARQLLLSSE